MKDSCQNTILETYSRLSDVLSEISENEINKIPFEGSWTAGQNVQHIILACSGLPALFAGQKEKTTRQQDENVAKLDSIFLDYTAKYESPENIKPAAVDYLKDMQLASIKKIQDDLSEAAEVYDLTLLCMDAKVPGFENFTIYEWIHFAIVHTQRHTHQLENIAAKLRNSN